MSDIPEQALAPPHLQTFEVQVSVVPEQALLAPHLQTLSVPEIYI